MRLKTRARFGTLYEVVRATLGFSLVALLGAVTSCTATAVSGGGAGGSGTTATDASSASTGIPSPCDGLATGADCAPKACVDGTELGVSRCDASGQCVPSDQRSCGYYACARGTPTCMVSCSGSADCARGAFCENEACQPGRASGAPCGTQEECASRSCVDGVCCEDACEGACEACTAAKKGDGEDGVCGPIAMGTDPDAECTQSPVSTCGKIDTCDGAGACSLHPAGEVCLGTVCAGLASLQGTSNCDGNGVCVAGPVSDCPGNLACDSGGGACFTNCAGTNDRCAPGYQCLLDFEIGYYCAAV